MMKKCGKKALALLLSVLMLCAMLPITAFAAAPEDLEATNTGGAHVEYKLAVGKPKNIPAIALSDVTGLPYQVNSDATVVAPFTRVSYENLSKLIYLNKEGADNEDSEAGSSSLRYANGTSTTNVENNATAANGVFDMTQNVIEVSKGETFWVGIKTSLKNTTDGLVGYGAFIAYDSTAFDVSAALGSYIDENNPTAQSSAVMNNIVANGIRIPNTQRSNFPNYVGDYGSYCTIATITSTTAVDRHKSGTNFLQVNIASSGAVPAYGIPNTATWDVILPITVSNQAVAGQTYYLDMANETVATDGGNKTINILTAAGTNGSYTVSGSMSDVSTKISSNVVTVKVISNDPMIAIDTNQKKIDPLEDQEVVVKYTKGAFANNAATNYEIYEKGQSTAIANAVTEVTLSDSNATATLTVDGSLLDAGKEYTVKLLAAGSSPSSGEATDLTTSGTFAVKAAADHGVTISNSATGSAYTYGDTLTATAAVAAGDNGAVSGDDLKKATWKWVAIDGDGNETTLTATTPEDATTSTYTIKGTDIGKTIKAVATVSTDTHYGAEDDSTATAVVAKTLTLPDADTDFTDGNKVKEIVKGAASDEVPGTFKFTAAEGLVNASDTVTLAYTGKYTNVNDTAGTGKEVTLTWAQTLDGAQKDYYDITIASGANYKGNIGEIVEEGYKFTHATYTFSGMGGKSGDTDITVTGIPAGKKIKTNGVTLAHGTAVVTGINTFKFTAPAEYAGIAGAPVNTAVTIELEPINPEYNTTTPAEFGTETKYALTNSTDLSLVIDWAITSTAVPGISINAATGEITVAATTAVNKTGYTVTVASATTGATATVTIKVGAPLVYPVIADKTYNGKTDIDNATITFKLKKDDSPVTTVEADGTAVFVDAAVGDGKTVKLVDANGELTLKLKGTDKDNYDIDPADVTADIVAAKPTGATVAATAQPTEDAVITALNNAEVTVNGTIKETLASIDVTVDPDLVKDIAAAGGFYVDPATSATTYAADNTAAAGTTTITTIAKGDYIEVGTAHASGQYALANGGTDTDATTGSVIDPDTGTITVGDSATDGSTLSVYVNTGTADAATWTLANTITLTAVTEPEGDITKATNGDITYTISGHTFGSNYTADTADVVITLTISKNTFVPTFGFTVTFAAGDHGVITDGEDVVNVEEGGKVEATPVVTPDKGFTFQGWSLDGKTIVNPLTIEILEDTTFTAVYKKGFMDGYGDDKIRPAQNVTRAEFTKMMVIALGKYDYTKTYPATSFTDDKGKWYTNYIACAAELGWIGGYEDNTFKPNDPISRQEAANILYKALENINAHTTTTKITDFDSVATWAQKAVASMVEEGVFGGYEDGTFRPTRNISRAEAGKVISAVAGFEPTAEQIAEISKLASPYSDVANTSWAFPYVMFATGNLPDSYYGR